MTGSHSRMACRALKTRPTTVIAASYGVDGQLQNTLISGNGKQYCLDLDLPDEGIYILYQDRALQIAAPPCEKRKCNSSHICCCDTPQFSAKRNLLGRRSFKRRVVAWPMMKPCQGCLVNWLRLYQAAEAANKLNMQFLRHARTLTWASLYGDQAFHYDAELEEQSIRSKHNGIFVRPAGSKSYCPPRHLDWMRDAWSDFAESGCCKLRSIATLLDPEDDLYEEKRYTNERDTSETDSDWDDLDIPCAPTITPSCSSSFPLSPPSPSPTNCDCDDYDLIDDLIDREFPKLRKTSPPVPAQPNPHGPPADDPSSGSGSDDDDDGGGDEGEESDAAPAPVVIPPRNMAVGRFPGISAGAPGAERPGPGPGSGWRPDARENTSASTSTSSSWTSIVLEPRRAAARPALGGVKRSYLDLVEHGTPADGGERVRVKQVRRSGSGTTSAAAVAGAGAAPRRVAKRYARGAGPRESFVKLPRVSRKVVVA